MYYLDCVLIVIEYDRNSRLTDYKHYYNLNNDEKNAKSYAKRARKKLKSNTPEYIKSGDILDKKWSTK